jgi:hypothetical protein
MTTSSLLPLRRRLRSVLAVAGIGMATAAFAGQAAADRPRLAVGADNNNVDNPLLQPDDPAEAGGGRDQTLQFGDVLRGTRRDDLQIGRLGIDVMLGGRGADVMLGGTEHFFPLSGDRAFGDSGDDIFVWAHGDGSDLFDGGRGHDAVVLGLVGELQEGAVAFDVEGDQRAGEVFVDPATGLPQVVVAGSPGFCPVIDESFSADAAEQLAALDIDHLVQFVLRGLRDSFDAGEQDEDNGLRATLHLRDVEFLVCATREGGALEVLDLRSAPPTATAIESLSSSRLRQRLRAMVF